MIEMMITVVIVAVCLVIVLRVFSVCAIAVSDAYNSSYAVNILREKMDELQVEAVMEDGIGASGLEEDIVAGGREFTFIQEITDWEKEAEAVPASEEIEEETDEEEGTGLREVSLKVSWGTSVRQKSLAMKTILPARGSGHEF